VKGHFSDISVFEWSVPMVRKELRVKAPAEKPLATVGIDNAIGNISYTKKELSDGGMMHIWTATNSPQAFPEPSMPPLYTQVQVLRASTVKSWEDISSWYWQLCLPHMEKATPAVTNKVFEIGKDVDKIFRWVAENIRYMGLTMEDTSPGYAPHDVDVTFANRYGVCRDKAALLAAMLRIAGFDAYPVLIHAGAKMDEKVPVPFFNHAIVAIRDKSAPCGYRLMDPTNETSRDLMPSYLGGKSFLVACPEGEKLKVSPVTPATDNIVEIETTGTVGKDGTAYLKSEISFGGVNDGIYRGAFLRRKKDMMRPFVERIVASSLKGAELVSFEIRPENLHDMTKPLHLSLSIKVPECSFERKTSYELSIPFVSKAIGAASFILSGETSLEKRKYPLEVFSTAAVSERLTLNLDFGAGVPVFIPDSSEIKGKYGYFNTCKVTDGKLVATRKVAVNDIEFSPKEYSALREDMKRSDSHERKNIVFAKNALANANVHIVKNVTSYNVAASGSWIFTNEVHQKILTYDGKKRSSELIFNFNPAWKNIKLLYATVSNVNGQVSHVESKEISVMDEDWVSSAPRYKPSKKLIINLPSVEVGSEIKYAVETVVSNSPAPFYLTYYRDVKVPTDEKVFSIDGITERLVEPKVVPDENMQPEARLWRNVQIFSRATKSDTLAYLRKMAKTDKVFHDPVNKILAKSKQNQDCSVIRIVRDWMSENIRVAGPSLYESSYDAHMTNPKTVLNEGYASRMDYMRTMCALLKGAGEDADIVFSAYDASSVKSSAELDMNKHFNPHAFKYPLCRVKRRKGDVFIGLENKYTPIGSTSFDGAHFIDLKTGKFGVVRALAGLEEKYKTSYVVRIRENGSVDIDVTNEIFGYEAGQYRRKYSEMLPEDFNRHHQTLVGNIAQSATATGPLFTDVKSYPFVRKMSVFIPEFATLSKDEISLSIPWLSGRNQFASSTVRKTPFCIDSEAPNTINVKIIFPKGYTGIEHLPESFAFGNPTSLASQKPWIVQKALSRIGTSGEEKGRLIVEIEKTSDIPRDVMFDKEWFGFFKYRSHVETGKGANSVSAKKKK
jgi:hypothetical protein